MPHDDSFDRRGARRRALGDLERWPGGNLWCADYKGNSLSGLAKLSLRWLRLGIQIERIKPGNLSKTVVTSACTI